MAFNIKVSGPVAKMMDLTGWLATFDPRAKLETTGAAVHYVAHAALWHNRDEAEGHALKVARNNPGWKVTVYRVDLLAPVFTVTVFA